MTTRKFDSKLSQTIECLSDPATYNVVCHEHRLGFPVILEILHLGQIQPVIIWVFMWMSSMNF